MIITGEVIKGSGDGTKLGFPTININLERDLDLKNGVYAALVQIEENTYKGVLHYGPRHVFEETDAKFEVHIFDFDKKVYGQQVSVEVKEFIRTSINFPSLDRLMEQILKDCESAKELLSES